MLEKLDVSGLGLPSWIGWLILLVISGSIIYFLVRFLSQISLPKKKRKRLKPVSFLEVTEGEATNWEEAINLARRALQEGDLRRSLWLGHRLLLLRLDHRETITFARNKTNGTYLRECDSSTEGRELLVNLTQSYEEVIYAHRNVEPETVKDLLAQVEAL